MAAAASSAISYSATVNWLRRRTSPCSSTRVPSGSLVASHGWLNHTATIGPDSSATLASTIFTRRLRVGRILIERMTAATVAFSPTPSDAIGRTSRRSACARGKYSSRSPAVSSPSAAAASCARFGNETGWRRREGLGADRSGAASSSSERSSMEAKRRMRLMIAGAADLLERQQVPPGGLAAFVEVQLEAVGQCPHDLGLAERSLSARDAGHELATLGQVHDRLAEDQFRRAPRDQLVAGVTDGLAGAEAAQRIVARC